MVIETFAEPLERTYDETDLLTKIYHVNPNWKPGDPDDYRYIPSYVNEGYTGFLPVHLKINPPNFVHQWGIEQSNGLIEWKSLPILEDGKYKFYYNSGQEGPYGLGFVPVKRYNQNIDDYDFSVKVLEPNIATLKITDGVLDSILTMEGGTLNLPSSLPALNEATAFNTNGKDYATAVSIDLSELTYYPNMPMPQFNNGNGSNIIDITENNSTTTFEELDSNRKTIEYITTPENPTPTPLMRSIVVKKSNNETKGKTRDATTSNIVGYINVNIPPPSISSTISNNGYYKFNTNWNGLIQGTDQDHALSVNVQPSLQSKTVTIDSIESNQSTVIGKTGDYVSLIPTLGSNIYNNGEIEVGGSLGDDTYKLFDSNTSVNIGTTNKNVDIKFNSPKKVEKIWVQVGDGGSWRTHNQYTLYGCDNDQFTNLIQLYQSGDVGSYTVIDQVINNENSYKYYRIRITAPGYDAFSNTREIRLFEYQSEFYGLNKITIVNNTDSKIYKGYNNNNKYSITQTGDGTITIPTDYQALGEIKYNVNVPPVEVETGYNITGLYVGSTYYPFSSLSHSTSGHSGTNWCGVSISGDTYTLATIGNSHSKSLSGNVYYYPGKSSTVGIGNENGMVFSVSLSWDDEGFGTFTNTVQPTPSITSQIKIGGIRVTNSSGTGSDVFNISQFTYAENETVTLNSNYQIIDFRVNNVNGVYEIERIRWWPNYFSSKTTSVYNSYYLLIPVYKWHQSGDAYQSDCYIMDENNNYIYNFNVGPNFYEYEVKQIMFGSNYRPVLSIV